MEDFKLETKSDPRQLELLGKICDALVIIYNQIKSLNEREIKVSKLPQVRVNNLIDLKPYFEMVEKATKHLAVAITLMASKGSLEGGVVGTLQEIKDNSQKTNKLLQKLIEEIQTKSIV